MNAFVSAKKFMFEWLKAAKTGRVTTAIGVPMLVGALVQILYTFDADMTTATDWTAVVTLTLAGLGLTGSGTTPPTEPEVSPIAKPLKAKKTTKS